MKTRERHDILAAYAERDMQEAYEQAARCRADGDDAGAKYWHGVYDRKRGEYSYHCTGHLDD